MQSGSGGARGVHLAPSVTDLSLRRLPPDLHWSTGLCAQRRGDHGIDRCEEVTRLVLTAVFAQLGVAGVDLEGMVLKPNMVTPGTMSPRRASGEEIAARTVRVLKACVPSAVPGIAFLSGGQADVEATANLNAINTVGNAPWPLTFSYGRALQAAPQKAWSGKVGNVGAAQQAFLHRAEMNSLASLGKWKADLEKEGRAPAD